MKKKIGFIISFCIILTCMAIMLPAHAKYTKGIYTYEVYNGNATITDCSSPSGEITIPSELGGYPVTSIGYRAFEDCTLLTGVIIPEGVTIIYEYAFSNCTSLTNVKIPGSVTSICDDAFSNCESLINVTIPEGVVSIGDKVFYYCSSLTNITIPGSVTSIGYGAFGNCSSLTSVAIPEGVTSIGDGAFDNCSSLTSVTIPESITSIGGIAFYNCSSLTSMIIPEGITSIGNSAFKKCTSLTHISIPESVKSIGYNAFYNCNNLKIVNLTDVAAWYNIDFGDNYANPFTYANELYLNGEPVTDLVTPASVKNIDNRLSGCTNIVNITISEGAESIGYYAFRNCTGITNVTIPKSVKSIDSYAFKNCTNLKIVNISDVTAWYNIDFGGGSNPLSHANELYLNGEPANDLLIPASVKNIDDRLSGYTNIVNITISEGVESIGEYAFSYCTGITNVAIPESVTNIGKYAFEDCSSLTSVIIPESVTSIGNSAFYNCSSLAYIAIPESVKSIDNYAFNNCTNLKIVNIFDVTAWYNIDFGYSDSNPFYYASELYLNGEPATDLVIPASVKNIDNRLSGCTNIVNLTIPEGVESIGDSAFRGCTGITNVTIPKSVKSIGEYAFNNCTNLKIVNISDVTAWYNIDFGYSSNPFYYAKELYLNGEPAINLVIPASVKNIDSRLSGCTNIANLTISEGVESIGEYAFRNCTGIANVTIPKSVKSIGSDAFYNCTGLKIVNISDVAAWYNIDFGYGGNPFTYANELYLNGEPAINLVIPASVKNIDSRLSGCTNIANLTISEGVESIGEYAFRNCTGIANVTIPKSVKSIGSDAFYNCTGLKIVNISDVAAWYNIDFGYGGNPFTYANELYLNGEPVTDLVIPASVKNIDDRLSGCTNIVNITIPEGVESIGDYAFRSYTGITNVTIPEGVKSIGNSVFRNCTGITNVTIPKSMESIGASAFYYCTGIANVSIPESVTSIGNWAFSWCTNLQSITVPKSVTSIGSDVFYNCSNLQYIYYDGTEEDWNKLNVSTPWGVKICYYTGVTGISLDYETAEIAEGKTLHLTAAIVPEDATNKNVIWTTSNEDVAVVNDGYVTAVGAGDAVITATTEDRGYTAQCRITVKGSTSAEYFIFDNGCIKKYLGTAEEVIIPNAINGINVTEIGASAFENSTVKSVTLPYYITSIGDRAFFGSSLTELYFNGTTNDWKNIAIGTDAIPDNAVIHCETGVTSISLDKEEIVTAPGEQTSLTATVTPENAVNKKIIWSTSNENVAVVENGIVTAVSFGEAVITATSEDGAYTASCKVKVYTAAWKFSFQNGSITKYNGNDSIVIVPDTIDGIAVKSIGNDAFNGRTTVTSVTLPEGLVSIGIRAFENCSNLTDINIPLSVKSIGSSAFRNTGLSSVTLPEGLVSIEYNTFSDCRNLTDVKLPSTLKSIGSGSFYNCGISEISLPDSVASIGSYAFSHCSALTEINIPDRVTRIENSTFYDCKNLKNIYMSDNIAAIDEQAFTYCANLEDITLPKSVTSIGKFAFEGCTSLRNVHIYDMSAFVQIYSQGYSSSPLTYAENLYLKGAKVTDLVIPEGIKKVEGIFTRFSGFNSITFPKSLNYLGRNEFSSCKNLNAVYISDLAAWCNIDFNGSNPLSIAKNLYLNGNLVTDLVIPGGVTDIKSCAFENCTSVKRVTIGGNVGYIGERAFYGCPISTLNIPYNVHYISSNAFGNCTSLTEVSIGNGTARLEGAFNGCTSLKNITVDGTNASYTSADGVLYSKWQTEIVAFPPMSDIKVFEVPYGITEIPAYAFSNCKNLKRVILPDSITSIGKNAFYNCLALENVNIPKKVTSIGEYAFCYCSNLKNIVLPDGIDTIADSVFNGCSSLTEIAIPDSVAKIGNYAFGSCRSLSEIAVPDGVTSIGSSAFNYCDNLQKIIIPASVTYIGDLSENHAEIWVDEKNETYSSLDGVLFNKAGTTLIHYPSVNSRTEYAIPDGVKRIDYEAFCNSNLTAVTIPKSVTYITTSAFSNCNKLTDVYYGGTKADRGTLGTDNNILQRCTWHYTDGTEEGTGIPKIKAVGTTALPGGTAKVDIVIENNPGVAMVGFNLNYNSALELQSMKNGSIFDGNDIIAGNINKKPYVFTCVNGNTNKNTDGVLVSAIFKVKDDCEPGDYGIYLSQFEIYDINEHKIDFFADNAAVNVSTGDTHGINIIADIPQKDGTVIASLYDAADRLIRTKMYEPSDALNISFDESGAYVKIMQWNMETLEPFTKERTIDVAGNPQTALSISVSEYAKGGKIVIALYDAADRLVNTKIFAAAETINASFSKNGAYVKIMHLSDDMITPLEPSRYITVADNT